MTLDEKKYQRLLEVAVQGLSANGEYGLEDIITGSRLIAGSLSKPGLTIDDVEPPKPSPAPTLEAKLARLPNTESGKQAKFLLCASHLIQYIFSTGYYCTGGDLYRDPRAPYGSPTSNHRKRKAIDLNLFTSEGAYLISTDSHRPYGEWWEALGKEHGLPLRWGGRFQDGNHYEWND